MDWLWELIIVIEMYGCRCDAVGFCIIVVGKTSWYDGKPWNELENTSISSFARLAEVCGLIPLLHIDKLLWWDTWKELREYFHSFNPLLYRIRLATHVWLMIVVLRAWLVDIAWYRNWRYLCRTKYTYLHVDNNTIFLVRSCWEYECFTCWAL